MKPRRYLRSAFTGASSHAPREDGPANFSALTYGFDDIQAGDARLSAGFQDPMRRGLICAAPGIDPARRPMTHHKYTHRVMVLVEHPIARDGWYVPPPCVVDEMRMGAVLSGFANRIEFDRFHDISVLER